MHRNLFAQQPSPPLLILMRIRCLLSVLAITSSVVASGAGFSDRYNAIRAAASPEELYRFLYALPKGGDLHNHFGGANFPEWMWEILNDPERNGDDQFYARVRFASPIEAITPSVRYHTIRRFNYERLPSTERAEYAPLTELNAEERSAWLDAFRLNPPHEGRTEFFSNQWPRQGDIYQNPHVRFELLAENIKAFAAEGLRYLELQFGIDGMRTNDGRLLSRDDALPLMEARLARPDVIDTGLVVRFQEMVLRFAPDAEQRLVDLYEWVDANRDWWVGLNMAGIEENGKGYPRRFLETYRELRNRLPTLPLSIHAGEMDGPDRHIRQTLLLGASRIGHGVNILGDPDTLLMLQHSQRTLIEINLISNQLLEYVDDLARHPFPELLRTGVPVCLNTDDRGMWDSNMTDEYYTAVTAFNLSWEELVQLGRNSLRYSFVDEETKALLIADYEADLEAFTLRYASGSVQDALSELKTVPAVTHGYAARKWGIQFTDL